MSHRVRSLIRQVIHCGAITVMAACSSMASGQDTLSQLLNVPLSESPDELPPPAGKSSESAVAVGATAPEVPRIYLGLEAEQPTEGIGVLVAAITKDSPAWKAGFKMNDRILGINGYAIADMSHMIEQLGKTKPGETVNFLVNRDGRNLELLAVLMNADLAGQIQNNPSAVLTAPAWLGITSHDLTNSFKEQFGIGTFRGAAVTQVAPNSPAYQAGIRPGDAIIEAGGKSIETAEQLQNWVEKSKPGDASQIVFYRGSARRSAKLVLTPDPRVMVEPGVQPLPPIAQQPTVASVKGANQSTTAPANPSLNAEVAPSDAPLMLTPDPAQVDAPTKRELALQAEVATLKQELADAKAKLAETKQQLDNILRALKD